MRPENHNSLHHSPAKLSAGDLLQEAWYLLLFPLQIVLHFFKKVPERPSGHKRPVVMLAGFLSSPLLWRKMARTLHAKGHPVYIPDLALQITSAAGNAKKLEKYLEKHNIQDAIFLAHSLAGLIAASLSPEAKNRFHTIYLMGVPLKGTWIACLFPCLPLVFQAIPGTRYLKTHCSHFIDDKSVRCIYNTLDEIILPNSSTRLGRPDDLLYPHFGHLHMIMSPESAEFMAELLSKEKRAAKRRVLVKKEFTGLKIPGALVSKTRKRATMKKTPPNNENKNR